MIAALIRIGVHVPSALKGAEAVIDPGMRVCEMQSFPPSLSQMCENTNVTFQFFCASKLFKLLASRTFLLIVLSLPSCSLHSNSSEALRLAPCSQTPGWCTEFIQAERVGSV